MFYSSSTGGFYTAKIHGDNMPDDVTSEPDWSLPYVELMEGQAQGKRIVSDENGFPVLADPPKPGAPSVVTMRQARLALLKAGMLDQVNSALNTMQGAEGEAARIEWEYSQEVWRNRPFVILLGDTLGLTPEQIDDLFIEAATL